MTLISGDYGLANGPQSRSHESTPVRVTGVDAFWRWILGIAGAQSDDGTRLTGWPLDVTPSKMSFGPPSTLVAFEGGRIAVERLGHRPMVRRRPLGWNTHRGYP